MLQSRRINNKLSSQANAPADDLWPAGWCAASAEDEASMRDGANTKIYLKKRVCTRKYTIQKFMDPFDDQCFDSFREVFKTH